MSSSESESKLLNFIIEDSVDAPIRGLIDCSGGLNEILVSIWNHEVLGLLERVTTHGWLYGDVE